MEIKKIATRILNFVINRIIEIVGISIVIIGLFLLVSLSSFSPDDPNFIFPDNTQINNLLGFQGSFTADLFFQSFGLISLLIPFSFIFSGIKSINGLSDARVFLISFICLYNFQSSFPLTLLFPS